MITTEEAFGILEKLQFKKRAKKVPLFNSRNCILAETVYSPINMPPFRQATMDGFALALHDSLHYEIIGEIKAGDFFEKEIQPGQAIKIFTGAAVPDSAEAVIQIEKVTVMDSNVLSVHERMKPETNIRQKAAQIAKDEVALEEGTLMNAAAIGFLAGLGISEIEVWQKPKIALIVTGNELVHHTKKLPKGKVYDSNTLMLTTALFDAGFEDVQLFQVEDNFTNTMRMLERAINGNDIVLVTGGISVGDYDFVGLSLEALKVETLFYKVNQKPGKPLYVGRQNDTTVFALPGNPAASLTCFYVYVLPTLQKISGFSYKYGSQLMKRLAYDFTVDNPRSQFLKAFVSDDEVTILSHQDSGMLNSFALANALVYVPNGNYHLSQGDKVSVYLIGN